MTNSSLVGETSALLKEDSSSDNDDPEPEPELFSSTTFSDLHFELVFSTDRVSDVSINEHGSASATVLVTLRSSVAQYRPQQIDPGLTLRGQSESKIQI